MSPETGWQRLSVRMIWVDVAWSVLSLSPALIALLVVGVDAGAGEMWPLIGIAAFGVLGALADAIRWVVTRYRITPTHVELKTGLFLRVHRSMQRDRVRSVDTEAKLRHRLGGLRVVKIGAGQQSAAGESALELDAVSVAGARSLQADLLGPLPAPARGGGTPGPAAPAAASEPATGPASEAEPEPARASGAAAERAPEAGPEPVPSGDRSGDGDVIERFERFRPRWVVYNMVGFWGYILAVGLGWGALWLLGGVGIDVAGFVTGLGDWEALGWVWTAAIAFAAVTAIGATGLAVVYFTEYWNFRLDRVQGPEGTMLRTRQGLFTTRDVSRDENRIRGAQISEPVLWRWMGLSDTAVITTGLNMWSMSQPAAILPRGPVTVTRKIADRVLDGDANPFETPLAGHPRAALRRRLWWATAGTAAVGLVLAWLALTGVVPAAAVWVTAALWPCAIGAALIAYRALGHAIAGPYLVTRSGLVSRATTVLRRSAVSTIVVRESLLQRRLGLRSVATMTAAGYGGYDTPDLGEQESLAFAAQAAPGLLDPFLSTRPAAPGAARPPAGDHPTPG